MNAPDWLHDAIFYQLFPDRFANGDPSLDPPDVVAWESKPTRDNFFGGDLRGIINHLDHITHLGANALYLTPIFEARTNHRYDAVDYFTIDHRLGSLEDFREFIAACHSAGIRVVLDAVLNHCGEQHWAFRDVVEKQAESDYVNWFSVEGFPVTAQPEPNYRTCSGCWYLPKWNIYNPKVREHHYQMARHWIDEGIDGWRLDVPYFINRTFWRRFREVVKDASDALYIVAVEWRDPVEWLQGDIADGTMNYTLRDLILDFTADRSIDAFTIAERMNDLNRRIPNGYHRGMLNLLGSHDTERVFTRHHGNTELVKLAYDLMFTALGAPMIYYGDEIGLAGDNDPGCRGAFIWNQESWNKEILEHVRNLGRIRKNLPTLRYGTQEVTAFSQDIVVVCRRYEGELTAAIVNRGEETASVAAALDKLAPERRWLNVDDGCVCDASAALPARTTVILTTHQRLGI